MVGNDSEPFRFTLNADHLTLGDGEIDANRSALDELYLDGRSTDAGERLREHLALSCGQIVERLTEYLATKTTPDVEYIW